MGVSEPAPTCHQPDRVGEHPTLGEAPNKCNTFPYCEWLTPRIISLTIIVTPDFSSDLERAPGAGSSADEKSGVTIMVNEIWKV